MLDKVRGGLFGVAVGDALGATFEFMTREEILSRHGSKREMVGGGWLGLQPGEVMRNIARKPPGFSRGMNCS
jgi:ADP-ribosyl-[dinitrogen reductase] hydrolase